MEHALLAGEALVVGTVAGAEEDLGGDDEVGATPAELLDDTAPACGMSGCERGRRGPRDTHISISELPDA